MQHMSPCTAPNVYSKEQNKHVDLLHALTLTFYRKRGIVT